MLHSSVIYKLHSAIAISKEEELHFNFLGFQIHEFPGSITLDQKSYVQKIKPLHYDKALKKDTVLSLSDFKALRSLVR